MRNRSVTVVPEVVTALVRPATVAMADDDKIIVGFATAQSGLMQAYDSRRYLPQIPHALG